MWYYFLCPNTALWLLRFLCLQAPPLAHYIPAIRHHQSYRVSRHLPSLCSSPRSIVNCQLSTASHRAVEYGNYDRWLPTVARILHIPSDCIRSKSMRCGCSMHALPNHKSLDKSATPLVRTNESLRPTIAHSYRSHLGESVAPNQTNDIHRCILPS